jgi:putative primosomal protein
MSRIATDWAWSQAIKPATHKLILLSMADRADEHHCCYPSIARLERDTGLDRKTIQKGVAAMIESGLITDTGKRAGATNQVRVLRLNIGEEAVQKRDAFKAVNKPKNGNVTESGNVPKNGMGNDPNFGMGNDPKNGIQNQSLNHPMNHIPPSGDSACAHTTPPPSPEPKPAKAKKPRQEEPTRIPEDFAPSESSCAWFASKGYAFDRDEETEKFCDYWRESKRDNAWKMDWQAAWKNWMRRTHEGFATMPARRQPPQPFAGQGCTFDQQGREVVPGAGVPMASGFGGTTMPPQRTSKMAQGISLLEELKDEIRRGEV